MNKHNWQENGIYFNNSELNFKKVLLSKIFYYFGLSLLGYLIQRMLFGSKYIRIINYHDTPLSSIRKFEEQLNIYKKYYCSVSEKELDDFLNKDVWEKSKPGLIISFDDGLRTNFDIAKPLLEKNYFTGWFFIPTDFIDSSIEEQNRFAIENRILIRHHSSNDTRVAMSWDEVKTLSKCQHIIGSHTRSHCRMVDDLEQEKLIYEIIKSKQVLEDKLNKRITSFCWVGGEEHTYSSAAAKIVQEANYKFSFMTNSSVIVQNSSPLHLDRTNIESSWSKDLILFQLSGFMDILYFSKRKRVHGLTGN